MSNLTTKRLQIGGAGLMALMLGAGSASAQISYNPNFTGPSNPANVQRNGNASYTTGGTVLQLTPPAATQRGTGFFTTAQVLANGFTTTFTFRITPAANAPVAEVNPPGANQADGLAFVIQNNAAAAGFLGATGGYIGYSQPSSGAENVLGVEFDTFSNAPATNDPSNNHIAIHSAGTNNTNAIQRISQLGVVPVATDFSDGTVHTVTIVYTPPPIGNVPVAPGQGSISVNLDGGPVELTTPVDLENIFGYPTNIAPARTANKGSVLSGTGAAFVGFASATAAQFSRHEILSWNLSITPDDPLPVELSSLTGGYNKEAINLSWSTASEINNAGFVVLRDGIEVGSFATIPALRGANNSAATNRYSFTDSRVLQGRTYTYQLKSVDHDGTEHRYGRAVTVLATEVPIADQFQLSQNSPNPFNPSTTISFEMPEGTRGTLTFFDALGRQVKRANVVAGQGNYFFNAANLPAGMYFYRLDAGTFSQTKRMMLVK